MQRKIEFRGMDKETGEWRYGQVFFGNETAWMMCKKSPPEKETRGLQPFKPVEVLPETVGQFTGLLDKNGVKIFEHDKGIDPQGNIGEVFYHNESAQFAIRWKRKDGTFDTDTCFGYFEIHTNPQLNGGRE